MTESIATLADADRRTVLSCLETTTETVEFEDLAAEYAAEKNDVIPENVGEAELERALVRLHHVHLPKLEQAGFLEYDHHNGTVRRRRERTAAVSFALSD